MQFHARSCQQTHLHKGQRSGRLRLNCNFCRRGCLCRCHSRTDRGLYIVRRRRRQHGRRARWRIDERRRERGGGGATNALVDEGLVGVGGQGGGWLGFGAGAVERWGWGHLICRQGNRGHTGQTQEAAGAALHEAVGEVAREFVCQEVPL